VISDIPSTVDAAPDLGAALEKTRQRLDDAARRIASRQHGPDDHPGRIMEVAAACWRDARQIRALDRASDAVGVEVLAAALAAMACDSLRDQRGGEAWWSRALPTAEELALTRQPGALATLALTLALRARSLLLCHPLSHEHARELATRSVARSMSLPDVGDACPLAESVIGRAKLLAGDVDGAADAMSRATGWVRQLADRSEHASGGLSAFTYTETAHQVVSADFAAMAVRADGDARRALELAERAAATPDLTAEAAVMLRLAAAFALARTGDPSAAQDEAVAALLSLPPECAPAFAAARAIDLTWLPEMASHHAQLREAINTLLSR
jgi:hypothetical protein